MQAYFWIEEEGVAAPWEGLDPAIQIWIWRGLRQSAVVFLYQGVFMSGMLRLDIVHPCTRDKC